MADQLTLKDVLAIADSHANAEPINAMVDVQVEASAARASQQMTDAADDRRQLIESSATVSTIGWDPKYVELMKLNVEYIIESTKPRRRRR